MNANNDDRTYVKLFRKILDWGWYGDTNTFRVFMHIILRANYEPSEYRGVTVPAGGCVFGYNAWAKQLGLSVQQIRTAISHLKSTGEITMVSTSKFSVVTLAKWEFWQVEEGKATSKSTSKSASKQQATNKQATTSKESKKVRNTTTPTIEEVRAYIAENNLHVDADYFYKYYTTAEWKDVKGDPVKNWKLKALNWSRRDSNANDNRTGNGERSRIRSGSGTDGTAAAGPEKTVWPRFRTMEECLPEMLGRSHDAGMVSGE